MARLDEWSRALRLQPPAWEALGKFVAPAMESSDLTAATERRVRSHGGIEVVRRQFAKHPVAGREEFLDQIKSYLAPFSHLATAAFEIVGIEQSGGPEFKIELRYEFAGTRKDKIREGRIGRWITQWSRDDSNSWQMHRLQATEETVSRAASPIFLDVTSHALGQTESYKNQMAHGADYWRTVLDGAIGVDVYGNNGVAVGDLDNSGFDSLYVCQPAGLPNRLYRNRGDGSFEDVTEKAGVGVLDGTACALLPISRTRDFRICWWFAAAARSCS